MHSFIFGDSKQPLYGVHHAPADAVYQDNAVLICQPLGQDYYRCHTLLRNLANSLAAKGYHVLRFDYRGTGDSCGELPDYGIEHWLDDIQMAISELRAISGVNSVTMIGVRMGGYLCLHAALQAMVTRLILWDGVIDTASYLQELASMNQQLLTNQSWFKHTREASEQQQNELAGFRYSGEFIYALRSKGMPDLACVRDWRISAVFSADSPQQQALDAALCAACANYTSVAVAESAYWMDIERFGNLLSGLEITRAIVGEVTR